MKSSIIEQVVEQLNKRSQSLQQQVLQFAQSVAQVRRSGTPGQNLLKFAGIIPSDDLTLMAEAIEEDCGKVCLNEW